jgi:hypothetical protein
MCERDIELRLKFDGIKSQLSGTSVFSWNMDFYPGNSPITVDEYNRALDMIYWAHRCLKSKVARLEREATRTDRILSQVGVGEKSPEGEV